MCHRGLLSSHAHIWSVCSLNAIHSAILSLLASCLSSSESNTREVGWFITHIVLNNFPYNWCRVHCFLINLQCNFYFALCLYCSQFSCIMRKCLQSSYVLPYCEFLLLCRVIIHVLIHSSSHLSRHYHSQRPLLPHSFTPGSKSTFPQVYNTIQYNIKTCNTPYVT